jgi:hypothetical protein
MLADPLVLVTDWTAITAEGGEVLTLPATERAADHSSYQYTEPDAETWKAFVGHQYGKRNRYTARVLVSGLVPDLLISGNSSLVSQSCYVVFDCPTSGPVNFNTSGKSTAQVMMHVIGSLLHSVDTADPAFMRVLNGET